MRRALKFANARKRGFALLMVMILVILLSVLVMSFVQDVSRELMVTKNVRTDLQASYLAQMGLIRGQVLLKLDEYPEYDSLNESWSQPLSWDGETWGSTDYEGGEAEGLPPPQVLISDEERKFNLLTLVRGNQLQRQRAAEVLARLIDICLRQDPRLDDWLDGEARRVRRLGDDVDNTDTLIRSLVSYLEERASEDSDNLEISVGTSGREPDVRSMKKQTPYEMLTVGELLQVEGWTEELLYGRVNDPVKTSTAYTRRDQMREEDREEREARDWRELSEEERFEHRRDLIEGSDERSRSPNPLPLISYVTLYSTGRINVNTASRELLLALHEDLTWPAVDHIITSREQARVDVVTADETGELPYEEEEQYPTAGEVPEEEEDLASFRPQDLASYQAFVDRVNNQQSEEEEAQSETIETESMTAFNEDFNEEIYAAIRPWLVVRSTVFSVESSATVENVTHTIRAIYRRSGQNNAGGEQPPGNEEEQPEPTPNNIEAVDPEALPPEPEIQLSLLLRDVRIGGE